jgi:hypothetical protein
MYTHSPHDSHNERPGNNHTEEQAEETQMIDTDEKVLKFLA